ncbi:MAG: DUF4450 domain-containing protein [Candidatus Hydrogenedentales bacterium]|jgi:hypothetical protein
MARVLTVLAALLSMTSPVHAADSASASGTQAVAPFRYHPEGADIVIVNGKNHFNRPLYGSNTIFFVYAGDLPEFLLSLPGKGGTMWLGISNGTASKWLSEADTVVARYRAGAMRYEIRDALLGPGTLTIDVVPMGEAEGTFLQIATSADAAPVDLTWAFGGASGFMKGAWNFDTARYTPEASLLFQPSDCAENAFTVTDTVFELRAPCHGTRPVAGTAPAGSAQKVADASAAQSPNTLWESTAQQLPLLAGRRPLKAGETLVLSLEWLAENGTALPPDQVPAALAAAEAHRAAIAERVRVTTPDPYINAAVPAICAAADGLWEPPTYAHGGVAWHMPYLGWRGAYIASEFGWNDRAKIHFRTFAKYQFQEPATSQARPDPEYNLARQAPDSVLYTRGYIPNHPVEGEKGQCDMQQVYFDQLLWHLLWTGDLEFAKEMWPVLQEHFAWEKRCFDPDDDGLYENFANTLISDAHHYSGSPCTQASAYNYRSLRMAAKLAALLGNDPEPFQREADKTLAAMNRVLWMPDVGWYAEYRDLLGLQRLHPSAELPSVYHPIDSGVPDMFQAYQMLRYVDTEIEHVPVEGNAAVLWASNWVPYIWSTRNILPSEVSHTALAGWQAGQRDIAWNLYRGAVVDAMYAGRVPGNCVGTSEHDGRWSGACSDFCCSVGMFGRGLVEGLFGIVPDLIDGELLIRPGLPRDWESASIDTPEVGYTYTRTGETERFEVRSKLSRPARLRLRVAARAVQIAEVTVNGQKSDWIGIPAVTEPVIEVVAGNADGVTIEIHWQGDAPARVQCPDVVGLGEPFVAQFGLAQVREVNDPQKTLKDPVFEAGQLRAVAAGQLGHRTAFARLEQGGLAWWAPVPFEIRPPLVIRDTSVDWLSGQVTLALRNNTDNPIACPATAACADANETVALQVPPRAQSDAIRVPAKNLVPGHNPIALDLGQGRVIGGAVVDWQAPAAERQLAFECVDLNGVFNDRVSEIFKHEYLSPRSPYCSLQIPLHGFGDWNYCGKTNTPAIDDSALRAAAGEAGRFVSPQGIPLATPGPGDKPNVVFTSQWDNFPKDVSIPVAGRARHAWFLVAGSTHPMQSQLDNGEILVAYADGQSERLPLHNPTTWWPIEADYDTQVDAFCIPGPYPPRIDLGVGRATLLDLSLNPERDLQSITVRCLSNDIVVGLMSVTLLRP